MGTSEVAIEQAEKRGFDTGFTVTNPFNGGRYPSGSPISS
jgi:leucyl-tRNA synthetase